MCVCVCECAYRVCTVFALREGGMMGIEDELIHFPNHVRLFFVPFPSYSPTLDTLYIPYTHPIHTHTLHILTLYTPCNTSPKPEAYTSYTPSPLSDPPHRWYSIYIYIYIHTHTHTHTHTHIMLAGANKVRGASLVFHQHHFRLVLTSL